MTFTPNIPASGQTLGSSQPQILNNFAVLRSTIAVNHVDVNATNPGTHTHVDLIAQSANPNPATGFVSHYSKTVGGVTQWFFQRENSGSVIQMSNGTPVASTNGQTFLPGGLILQYGSSTSNSVSYSVSFNITFPTNIFSLVVTPQLTGGSADSLQWLVTTYSKSGFTIALSQVIVGINYIAIGN